MYRIAFKKSAVKEIKNMPAKFLPLVVKGIDNLAENPRPEGCAKLKGKGNLWRIRIGDYRIIYSIDDHVEIIEIYRVRHRKDAYRN